MAMQVLLDDLDITDWIQADSLDLPTPLPGDADRLISMLLFPQGATSVATVAKLGQVQAKLTQAALAAQPWSNAPRMTLTLVWADLTSPLYFDLLGGQLDIPPEQFTYRRAGVRILTDIGLVLRCLPLARGAPLTLARNYIANSNTFQTTWTTSETSVTPNVAAALDGTLTADKLLDTTTSAAHYLTQTGAATTAGATIYASVVAKSAEYSMVQVRLLRTAGTVIGNVTFNLATGTVQTTTSGTPTITSLGNGWYRCTVAAANVDTTSIVRIHLHNGTSATFAGTGTSGVYVTDAYLGDVAPGAGTIRVEQPATTLTGLNSYAVISNVPGDAPALVELDLDDLSTGVVVHSLRVARYAAPNVSTYTPILDAAVGAAAGAVTVGGDYLGTSYARIATSSPSAWQELATFAVPFRALSDVWLRIRDSAVISNFPLTSLTVQYTGGLLPQGSYTYVVAVYTGSTLLGVSAPRACVIPEGTGLTNQVVLDWDDITGATVLRVYWQHATTPWQYFELTGAPGALSTYTHTTLAGALTGDPPADTAVQTQPTLVRAKLLVDTQTVRTLDPRTVALGQAKWERLELLTAEALPPHGRREHRSDVSVTLAIEAKAATAVGTTIDVDGATLLDAGQGAALYALTTGLPVAPGGNRRWLIDTARDGAVTAALLHRTTGAVLGLAAVAGGLTFEPYPLQNHLTIMPLVAGEVSSTAAALALALKITPRYRDIRGLTA